MKGKIAIVTGANGGLGNHVTLALLEAGATVIGVSREIRQSDFNSPAFTALPAEISKAAGAKSMVDGVISRFGRLDVVVHTVGGFAGGQSIAETDDATFQRMFDLNLNSTFYLYTCRSPSDAEDR
jgi:NAD(P)-dependent dehydrogenase (short-subunit alcohol dehydrogenase family)